MRRVDCRRCGVVAVEEVPWGDGKCTLTKAYMLFPSPLGAATVMERHGAGLSHLLGQSLRRGGTRRRLRAGAPGSVGSPPTSDCHNGVGFPRSDTDKTYIGMLAVCRER